MFIYSFDILSDKFERKMKEKPLSMSLNFLLVICVYDIRVTQSGSVTHKLAISLH